MAIVLPCSMIRASSWRRPRSRDAETALSELLGADELLGLLQPPLRIGDEIRLLVHRARCSSCRRTHALIPTSWCRPPRRHRGDRPGSNRWQATPRRRQPQHAPGALHNSAWLEETFCIPGGALGIRVPRRHRRSRRPRPTPSRRCGRDRLVCHQAVGSASRRRLGLSVTTGVSPTRRRRASAVDQHQSTVDLRLKVVFDL